LGVFLVLEGIYMRNIKVKLKNGEERSEGIVFKRGRKLL